MEENEESPRSVVGGGGGGPGGHMGAAKRGHRTACNSCKRMKVRCEWDQEGICNRCSKHQTECIFTIPERKKREKKETYLTTLEDRLNRMEAVMRKSGLSMPGKEAPPALDDAGISEIQDKLSVLKIFDDGSTLFIGASSGFSIFGQYGLKWVSEVTGSDDFARALMAIPSPQAHIELVSPSMWYKLPDEELEPLPKVTRAMKFIDEFFNGFAGIFPLFSRAIFMERFARQYPVKPSEDAAWYACLNVIFAIGSVSHSKNPANESPKSSASSPRSQNPQDEVWWPWFRNASSTYIDLQFREGNICAVQAMIGMAFILQTLPNPYPCSVLAGAALRLAHTIGLHRSSTDVGLSHDQVEERRNVFWTGVVVEQSIVMRSGRPSVMQEDDIGVDLPKPDKSGAVGPEHPQPLRYMSTLSLLQGRIYNKLYSAKATARPVLEKLQWVSTLDEELQEWKDSLPIEIRPGNELTIDSHFHLPILMMHYGYFNSLATIHRCSIHYKSWSDSAEATYSTEALANMKLNPRVFASGAITVGAARSVIHLLKHTEDHIDMTELNVVRMLDYYPLSACLVLFANVLQNPRDPQALADVGLMQYAVKFLSDSVDGEEKTISNIILKTFTVVNNLAARYVEKTLAQGTQNPKRAREPLKTPNYVLDSSPFDDMDQSGVRDPPGTAHSNVSLDDPFHRSTSSSTAPPQTYSSTSTPAPQTTTTATFPSTPHLNQSTHSTPTAHTTPSHQTQPHPYIIHLTQNQPDTTQQFLDDPLAPQIGLYGNDMYNTNMSGIESGFGGGGGIGGGGGMDFFPNDIFMPNDGSWFFPLTPNAVGGVGGGVGNGSGVLGSPMGGSAGLAGGGGGVGGSNGGLGGLERGDWMGFGWSMGGDQGQMQNSNQNQVPNIDWELGGTGMSPDQRDDGQR